MAPSVRQTNFSAGEISPLLWARTDLPAFANGLRTCRNFFISREGAAISRPGTTLVCETKYNARSPVRLVPFVYSDTVSYVLEFGNYYMRVHTDGGTALEVGETVTGITRGASATVITTATPHGFSTGDWVFLSGIVGTTELNGRYFRVEAPTATGFRITHTYGYILVGVAPFTYTQGLPVNSSGYGAYVSGGRAARVYELATPYLATDLAAIQWAQMGATLLLTHPAYAPRELSPTSQANWQLTEFSVDRRAPTISSANLAPLPTADAVNGKPAREWSWAITELYRDERGILTESAPYPVTSLSPSGTVPSAVAVYPDKPVTVEIMSTRSTNNPNFLGFRVYRGRGGIFGWVGDAASRASGGGTTTVSFTDIGDLPNYARPPPQGRNPFKIYNSSGVLAYTEHPAAVAFFQERLVFGGTTRRPGFLFLSATGEYDNFDERLVLPNDTDALTYELAARRREAIRSLTPLGKLLVATDASMWAVGGAGGEPLAPSTIPDATIQDEVGASHLPPLVLQGAALFTRVKGSGVRALLYEDSRNSFVGVDISAMAAHLFTGFQRHVVDWAYAEDPFGLVWAARADGALLSLTYTGETWGWARHDTNGMVTNICSVPEGDEDAVYMVVARPAVGPAGQTQVEAIMSRFGGAAPTWQRNFIERMTSRVAKRTIMTTPANPGAAAESAGALDDICVDSAVKYAGPVVTTFTGLHHLEGQEVWAVSVGNPAYGPLTVANGEVTLAETPTTPFVGQVGGVGALVPWLVMHIGLRFEADLETLDVAHADARMRQKTVTHVGFEVDGSRGLWAGQDLEHLSEWRQRKVTDGYDTVGSATELVRVAVSGKWDESARAALRQTLPSPVTVTGLTRGLDIGS
jgi:hypothetical protein